MGGNWKASGGRSSILGTMPLRQGIRNPGGVRSVGQEHEVDHPRRLDGVVAADIAQPVGYAQRRRKTAECDDSPRGLLGLLGDPLQDRDRRKVERPIALIAAAEAEPEQVGNQQEAQQRHVPGPQPRLEPEEQPAGQGQAQKRVATA